MENCEIDDCPRFENGKCTLSNLDQKDKNFMHPDRCYHRKFRLKNKSSNKNEGCDGSCC